MKSIHFLQLKNETKHKNGKIFTEKDCLRCSDLLIYLQLTLILSFFFVFWKLTLFAFFFFLLLPSRIRWCHPSLSRHLLEDLPKSLSDWPIIHYLILTVLWKCSFDFILFPSILLLMKSTLRTLIYLINFSASSYSLKNKLNSTQTFTSYIR